jgi:KaiC/GvpD/RAD55 family RecA-like ATPase
MNTKKTSRLKGRDPQAVEPSKPKIVVYGKPGCGKTWMAMEFPNVFYIDTEGGADLDHYRKKLKESKAMYFGPEDGSLDFNSVLEQIQALATEEHDRKTLVIDSMSKLFNNQIAMTQEEMIRNNVEDAFGASKKPAIAYMRRLVAWINKLDMNVVLIHHQKSTWKDGKEVGVTFDGWDKLEYELHLVLQIEKMGPSRIARVGKTRMEKFPEASTFPWSFKEFSSRYGIDVIDREAAKLDLCTQEQRDAYAGLIAKVRVDKAVLEKWDSATPDVALLTSESMAKRIGWLEAQLKAQTATA